MKTALKGCALLAVALASPAWPQSPDEEIAFVLGGEERFSIAESSFWDNSPTATTFVFGGRSIAECEDDGACRCLIKDERPIEEEIEELIERLRAALAALSKRDKVQP